MEQGNYRFVIVTGMSGGGKTQACRYLEDLGFFCVDNLPPVFIPKFAELCSQSGGHIAKVVLVVDTRSREFFDTFGTPTEFLAGQDNLYLVSNALDKEKAPKIFMACGTEDGLFASNVKFRDHLISRGFDVTWQQGPGVHEWGFWDNYIQKVLEWLPIKE